MGPMTRALAVLAVAGTVVAGLLAPPALAGAALLGRASEGVGATSTSLAGVRPDAATTIVDDTGAPIAYLYHRFRLPVPTAQIPVTMKAAIVAIEDRRFFSHGGVDWPGLARALVSNAVRGTPLEGQGASTITMQYVKNLRLYALAETPAEREAATADTIARKLTEVRLAHRVEDRLTKAQILTRYLNLVYFGHGAYGVQAAARTYFGVDAEDLTVAQAALLAGLVRSPTGYDPTTHAARARARRDQVLEAMREVGSLTDRQAAAARATPLGVRPDPTVPPEGCAGARPGTGFFCDAVVDRLAGQGLDRTALATDGYTVRTTLDPRVAGAARRAATGAVPPGNGVADVTAVLAPGTDRRPVLALAANRTYGSDAGAGESALPLVTAPLRGAGSIYKIFTAATALEQGLVTPDTVLPVPARYTSTAFGRPYTVTNLGSYDTRMTLRRALALSPNTAFVALEDRTGSIAPIVDTARRLGLRTTLAATGGDGRTLAEEVVAGQRASFTLGPDPTSPLDLANVAATIVSDGIWCPPTLMSSVTDRDGAPVAVPRQRCTRAVPSEVATALRSALGEDHTIGTSAAAALAAGWDRPMIGKTGTTQTSRSAAFLGATDRYAASVMTFSDRGAPQPVCTDPPRTCAVGNLTGGSLPARTWYPMMTSLYHRPGPAPRE